MENKLNIITKENELFGKVRFAIIDGKKYAVARDVAKALGYKNMNDVINRKCKNKIKIKIPSKGGSQITTFISDMDIYILICTSKIKSIEYKKLFKYWLISENLINNKFEIIETKKEIEFINALDKVLKSFNIKGEKQYIVKNDKGYNYRIDYYIPNLNIAIEYDENGHANYTYEQQEYRQAYIENKLGCKFIRVSDKNSNEYNICYCYCNMRNELHNYIKLNIDKINLKLIAYEILKIRAKISKINKLSKHETKAQKLFELEIINNVMKDLYNECNKLKIDNEKLKNNLISYY